MSLPLRPYLLLCLLAVLPGLGGCLTGAPATRLYVLTPLDGGESLAVAQAANRPVALVVRDLRIPQYLDRPQIVTRSSDHRLTIAEFDQWGGDLREDMTRILTENLGHLLGSERVVAAPYAMALNPDFRLDVEVLRFERSGNGMVQLSARWWLTDGRTAALLASPEASFAVDVAGSSYEAVAAAMSRAYGELARAIADSVRKAGGT